MKKYLIFLAISAFALAGCVSTLPKESDHTPALRIAGNAEGLITIEWDTDPAYYYTVYSCQEKRNKKGVLRKLPQATSIRGTGKTITIHDRVRPGTPIPQYRLLPKKIN